MANLLHREFVYLMTKTLLPISLLDPLKRAVPSFRPGHRFCCLVSLSAKSPPAVPGIAVFKKVCNSVYGQQEYDGIK